MRTFTLHLQDAHSHERIESVTGFVGRDATGSFGIRGGHERFLTALEFGLARFRVGDAAWEFLAAPGGLVYMREDELFFCTRRYFRDTDYRRISETLARELKSEEESVRVTRASLRQMEDEMLRRLWRLGHE
jgi:F-type H+-transporting ATPase subunit epsilon